MRTLNFNFRFLLIALFAFVTTTTFAQFNESIDLLYGEDDVALNAQFTPFDGGQVTTGYSVDPIGAKHVNLVKTDAAGGVMWSKIFDIGGLDDQGNAVTVTASGDYLITGYFTDPFMGIKQLLVIRTDPAGGVLWTKAYPHFPFPTSASYSEGHSIEETASGDFIITGQAFDPVSGLNDLIVLRIDPAGTLMSSAVYNVAWDEVGYSIKEDPITGEIVVAGYITTPGAADKDILIVKLDPFLGPIWFFQYPAPAEDVAYACEILPSGEIIVAGESNSYSNGKRDVYMQMVDPAGALIWASIYGHKRHEIATSVELMSDGTLTLTGYTTSVPGGIEQVHLMRTDLAGGLIYSRHFGTPFKADYGHSVKEDLGTGEIIIAGIEGDAAGNPLDIYLLRTDPPAMAACARNLKFLSLYVAPPAIPLWCVPFDGAFELDPYAVSVDVPHIIEDLCCDCPDMFVDFTASTLSAPAGSVIDFTNLSDCIESYRWVINGTLVSTAENLSHTFAAPGTYTVKLVGKLTGCPNVSKTITIVITTLREANALSNEALQAWPNPAVSTLNLHAQTGDFSGTAQVIITDMVGKTVYQNQLAVNGDGINTSLNLENLSAGMYNVAVFYGENVLNTRLQVAK